MCFQCLRYGHVSKYCRQTVATCSRCGEQGHARSACVSQPKCIHCGALHSATDKECPRYVFECEVLTTQNQHKISRTEARDIVTDRMPDSERLFSSVVRARPSGAARPSPASHSPIPSLASRPNTDVTTSSPVIDLPVSAGLRTSAHASGAPTPVCELAQPAAVGGARRSANRSRRISGGASARASSSPPIPTSQPPPPSTSPASCAITSQTSNSSSDTALSSAATALPPSSDAAPSRSADSTPPTAVQSSTALAPEPSTASVPAVTAAPSAGSLTAEGRSSTKRRYSIKITRDRSDSLSKVAEYSSDENFSARSSAPSTPSGCKTSYKKPKTSRPPSQGSSSSETPTDRRRIPVVTTPAASWR